MDLTTDRRFHPLAIRKCCCCLPAFFCLLFMALSSPAWAQDNAASKDAPADQAVAAEKAEGSDAQQASESADAQQASESADAQQASESADAPGEDKKIDSPEDAETVVQEVAEDVKETTAQAVDALKSGDLTTAAKKSGELFTRYGIPAITVLVVLIVAYFVAAFLARICSAPLKKGRRRNIGKIRRQACFLPRHGECAAGCAAVLWDRHRQLCGRDCGSRVCHRLGVSGDALEFLRRRHVVGVPTLQSR